jgi:Uma2 family endonuclease
MTTPIQTAITQAELQRLDAECADNTRIEVEDGIIFEVKRKMTWMHLFVIQNLYDFLKPFVKSNRLGNVFMDVVRYVLKGTPDKIEDAPYPDFSFLRAGRLPKDFDPYGDFYGAPDLAVEVISPGQGLDMQVRKIARYLEAGSEEAWLTLPKRGEVHQYRRDKEEPFVYRRGEVLETPLFPGLAIALDAIFTTEQD